MVDHKMDFAKIMNLNFRNPDMLKTDFFKEMTINPEFLKTNFGSVIRTDTGCKLVSPDKNLSVRMFSLFDVNI